jgi:hypothetical protein
LGLWDLLFWWDIFMALLWRLELEITIIRPSGTTRERRHERSISRLMVVGWCYRITPNGGWDGRKRRADASKFY